MKEHEIRPHELAAEEARRHLSDVAQVLAHQDRFVSVSCPACGGDRSEESFQKGGFQFRECRACFTLFVSPRPTSDMLASFYDTAESIKFWNQCIYPRSESVRKEKIFRPRVRRVASILKGRQVDVLVDVGAGYGWFVGLCAEEKLAKRVIGIEPSSAMAESCRRFAGVEVIESPIETCYQVLQADVVTSFELVEHLFDPGEFLRYCFEGLKPGGIFVCTTPNWHGFDIQVLCERSSNIRAPNHINYFNTHSLGCLLKRVGFKDVTVTTPGELDIDILYNQIEAGVLRAHDLPGLWHFIRQSSPDDRRDFQHFLQRHGLSSNMMAVAIKP